MTLTREKMTYITLVVSEAAWLFAFISILGVAAGSGGSPLSFFAILGLLGLSTATYSYIRWKEFQAFELFYFGATLLGVILCYSVVAAAYEPDEAFTVNWIFKLIDSTIKEQGKTFHGVAGGLLAIAMWFRGIRLAMIPYPERSLKISFRLGLFFIGFAAIMDILIEDQLNVFAMVLIFFGAGLAGLNIGHLVPETAASAQTKTWPKVMGLAVVGVLVAGGMFGFLQQSVLEFITSPIRFVFDRVVEGLLLIVSAPIILGLEAINSVIAAFFSRPFEVPLEPEATVTPTPTVGPAQDFGFSGGGGGNVRAPGFLVFITQYVRYGLVVATVVVVAIFLYVLARKIAKKLMPDDESSRESIFDETNFASDIGDLFSDFMSNVRDLFKGAGRKIFRLPDGPPGVVEALRLYYQMITTAEQNEVPRPDHYTPNEFRRDLRSVFPNELVQPATDAFNRAQYGDIPTSSEEITKMRASFRVERAEGAARPRTEAAAPIASSRALGKGPRFETVTSEITEDPLARQRARFDSPSLTEKSWFSGAMGVLLACGGVILFGIVAAALFALVVFIGGG